MLPSDAASRESSWPWAQIETEGENLFAFAEHESVGYVVPPEDIVEHLDPMRTDPAATEAIQILRRDFTAHDGHGPMRVAEFIAGGPDDIIQADVVGFVDAFLRMYERS